MIKVECHISRDLFHSNNVYLLDKTFDDLSISGFSVEAMIDTPSEANMDFLHSLCVGVFWDALKATYLNLPEKKIGLFYFTPSLPNNRITHHQKICKNPLFRNNLRILLPYNNDNLPEVAIEFADDLFYATIIPIDDYEAFRCISNFARVNSDSKIIISTLNFSNDSQIKSLFDALHPQNMKMKRIRSLSSFTHFVCGFQDSCIINLFGDIQDDCCVKFDLFMKTESNLWKNVERFYASMFNESVMGQNYIDIKAANDYQGQ